MRRVVKCSSAEVAKGLRQSIRPAWHHGSGRIQRQDVSHPISIGRRHVGGMRLGVHLFYLVGFANPLVVLIRWAWSFLTPGRGTRLVAGEPHLPPIKRPEHL